MSNLIQIHLTDGRVIEGQSGASAEEFLREVKDSFGAPLTAVIINNELHELTYPIQMEARVQPLTMADSDGMLIYRRSLIFLLEAAFSKLFPDVELFVDHSIAAGGYYCHVHGRKPLKKTELENLEKEMRRLVGLNIPFKRREVSTPDAIEYFKKENHPDKVQLLKHRKKTFVSLYTLSDCTEYLHGYMVPATGYLRYFELVPNGEGFTLHFPRRSAPTKLTPIVDYPKLLSAFLDYGGWLERLNIHNVGALNDDIQAGRAREVVLISEALHDQRLASIARQIIERKNKARIVLVAGPSSSGKTTFSRRLAVQLLALGISPLALELDSYFVDREKSPRDENGNFDFETIDALDLDLLSDNLGGLLRGDEVQIPHYDFKNGKQIKGGVVQLQKDQIIILEGIHGLNPKLIERKLSAHAFRIYVSCLTQLNLDRHNRVSTTDTRLVRRIVRDARERGYTAQQTIQRWESVRRGEEKYIFPYQENADAMFNSALAYELSVLAQFALPLLLQVPHGTSESIETKRLLALLDWFLPVEETLVPDNSLLREFVGGSILKDFKVWNS